MDEPQESVDHVRVEAGERDEEEVVLDSVTLARLMAEVRNDDTFEAHAYNRMHNRHNR